MKMKLLTAIAALVACSGAWAEIIYLDCKTNSAEASDRTYVVDTKFKNASVHYDYGYAATGTAIVTAGSFQLSFGSKRELPKVEISRVSGRYRTEINGLGDTGECERVEKPNFRF